MNVVTDTIQALRSMRKRQVASPPPVPPLHVLSISPQLGSSERSPAGACRGRVTVWVPFPGRLSLCEHATCILLYVYLHLLLCGVPVIPVLLRIAPFSHLFRVVLCVAEDSLRTRSSIWGSL
jgi:hypothetical protein